MNYVYRKSEPGLYTVGYYDPSNDWVPESDQQTKELAAERVSYLNGNCMAKHGQPACYPIDENLMMQIYQVLYDRQDTQQAIFCVNELNKQFQLTDKFISQAHAAIDARMLGQLE